MHTLTSATIVIKSQIEFNTQLACAFLENA